MRLSPSQIDSLLRQEPITSDWPWSTNDQATIDRNIKDIVAEVRRKLRLLDKTEYGHYGSGYASFVDCWLYRDDDDFRVHSGNHYWGLVVLFSRLSRYFVLGQGEKSWQNTSGASYLPSFAFVDKIEHPSVLRIVPDVCGILANRGLVRLGADDLAELLPRQTDVPTILGDPPWRHFDALFYWED